MADKCTCNCGQTKCNTAFVYQGNEVIREIPIENVSYLKSDYTWLCAGNALKKINKQIKENGNV